jgi:hypothetical protein
LPKYPTFILAGSTKDSVVDGVAVTNDGSVLGVSVVQSISIVMSCCCRQSGNGGSTKDV